MDLCRRLDEAGWSRRSIGTPRRFTWAGLDERRGLQRWFGRVPARAVFSTCASTTPAAGSPTARRGRRRRSCTRARGASAPPPERAPRRPGRLRGPRVGRVVSADGAARPPTSGRLTWSSSRSAGSSPAPPPTPDRIFFTALWFRGHNNPRYAELLPRLSRLDRYLLDLLRPSGSPRARVPSATADPRRPRIPRCSARRRAGTTTSSRPTTSRSAHFPGRSCPTSTTRCYTPREVELLQPAERRRLRRHGRARGAALRGPRRREALARDPAGREPRAPCQQAVAEIARANRRDGEVVVGYMAASPPDRRRPRRREPALQRRPPARALGRDPRAACRTPGCGWSAERAPRARAPRGSRRHRALRAAAARPQALAHVANFDLALYPRTTDQGIQAAKVAEYMGLGVPTISYDYEVTEVLRETGAGVLVATPREFVDAVGRLALDPGARRARRRGASAPAASSTGTCSRAATRPRSSTVTSLRRGRRGPGPTRDRRRDPEPRRRRRARALPRRSPGGAGRRHDSRGRRQLRATEATGGRRRGPRYASCGRQEAASPPPRTRASRHTTTELVLLLNSDAFLRPTRSSGFAAPRGTAAARAPRRGARPRGRLSRQDARPSAHDGDRAAPGRLAAARAARRGVGARAGGLRSARVRARSPLRLGGGRWARRALPLLLRGSRPLLAPGRRAAGRSESSGTPRRRISRAARRGRATLPAGSSATT